MSKGLKRFALGLVAVGLCLVLLLTGAVPVCEAGPDGKVVKIGLHGILTGAIATVGVPMTYGAIDSARYVSERGGIDGVKIGMKWEDTRAAVPRSITAHRRFKEAGVVAEIYFVVGVSDVMSPTQQEDEIPALQTSGHFTLAGGPTKPIPWVFNQGPGMPVECASVLQFIQREWVEERPCRVGAIVYDETVARDFLEGFKYADKFGVEYIGHEIVPLLGTLDTSTEWLRSAGKEPDWMLVWVSGATLTTLVRDAARLEIQKKGIKLACCYGFDIPELRISGEACEGWYIWRGNFGPTCWQVERFPGLKAMLEAGARWRSYDVNMLPSNYIATWNFATIVYEGIRLAIEKVGYENLTGRAVRDGMASIKDFSGWDSGSMAPVTMSDDKPYYGSAQQIHQVQQGKIVPVSGDIEWVELPDPILKQTWARYF